MKFNFKIEEFPNETESYHVPAYTEGNLRLTYDGKEFLNVDGILLVEFAIMLKKWLLVVEAGRMDSFVYESMDFEESPILEFKLLNNSTVKPASVWQIHEGNEVALETVVNAGKNYLRELVDEVKSTYHYDLENRINQEIAAN